ncbi:MAG: leucine-rich repeat protein [Clostridiales bacterium]|nr:leucine-rich repeat protein [Clostridiales bacterium]
MKKIKALITALLILTLLIMTTAYAAATGTTADRFEYSISGDKATITGYMGSEINLKIPAYIGGVPVISIGVSAFSRKTELVSITIPSGVTSIQYGAFAACTNLASISIPSSVSLIEAFAFSGCSSLTSVTIPWGVTTISEHSFVGCTSLTSVTIPSSVTSIQNRAFAGCDNLRKIIIPSSVTYIGYDYVFLYTPVTVYGSAGSYVQTYAQNNNIPFEVLGQIMRGDANDDKKIDIMDLVAIIDYIVSDIEPVSIINADANASGHVDIMDLVWIIDVIVGS